MRAALQRRQTTKELMPSNCGAGEDSWKSLKAPRISNQSNLREINPKYSLEGLMLKVNRMQTDNSLEKSLMLGKIEGRREEGIREWDGWMASLIKWTWTWEMVRGREAWRAAVHGVAKSQTWLSDWTTATYDYLTCISKTLSFTVMNQIITVAIT